MNKEDKQKEFLIFSDKISRRSKDQSTQVGAVFFNKSETAPRTFGYNGMPRGLDDLNIERNQRPEKYHWMVHAELNGIYNVARETLENKIMFLNYFPDMDSGLAIVSAGIKEVICIKRDENLTAEQEQMHARVIALFEETNTHLTEVDIHQDISLIKHEELKRHRKLIDYLDILDSYAKDFSKDPARLQGAMIFNEKTFAPVENGFGVVAPPENIHITQEMYEEKEHYFLGAAKNAVLNSVKEKFEGTAMSASWCPCNNCSLAVVAVGIKKVITRSLDLTQEADKRWEESFRRSKALYEMAGVEFININLPKPEHSMLEHKTGTKMKHKP